MTQARFGDDPLGRRVAQTGSRANSQASRVSGDSRAGRSPPGTPSRRSSSRPGRSVSNRASPGSPFVAAGAGAGVEVPHRHRAHEEDDRIGGGEPEAGSTRSQILHREVLDIRSTGWSTTRHDEGNGEGIEICQKQKEDRVHDHALQMRKIRWKTRRSPEARLGEDGGVPDQPRSAPAVSLFLGRSWVLLSQVTDFKAPGQSSSVEWPTSSGGSDKSRSSAANSPPEDRQSGHYACGVVERRGTQLVEYVHVTEALRLDNALEVVRLKGGPAGRVDVVLVCGWASVGPTHPQISRTLQSSGTTGAHSAAVSTSRLPVVSAILAAFDSAKSQAAACASSDPPGEPAARIVPAGPSESRPDSNGLVGTPASRSVDVFACSDRVIARHSAAAVPAWPFRARRSGRGGSGCGVGVPNGTRTRVPTLKGWCPDL